MLVCVLLFVAVTLVESKPIDKSLQMNSATSRNDILGFEPRIRGLCSMRISQLRHRTTRIGAPHSNRTMHTCQSDWTHNDYKSQSVKGNSSAGCTAP